MKHPWREAAELEQSGVPFVMATLIAIKGHAPQDEGAKVLITHEGLFAGTVGGGNVEAMCIAEGKKILANPENFSPKILHWNLQRDVSMTCGGEVTFLFELVNAVPWRVIVFGAGHVGQSMAKILQTLNCRVSFVDSRSEWIEKLPKAENIEKICIPDPKSYVQGLLDEKNIKPFFVIMTKGHATDVEVLREVYQHFPSAPYVGLIASKVKSIKIRNEFKNEGFSSDLLEKLHCPMGLPFGNNDPAEIAISITAQLIEVRDRLLNPAR